MLHSYLEQLLISLMLSTSKIPLLPFSTWPFFVTPEIRLLPCPFCGNTFTFVVCGWGTQPLGFLKQGLWLRFCTECVCVCIFEITPCRKFNGPKMWDAVNRTKREETLVAGTDSLLQDCKTPQATQQEKNSPEINLSFVLLCLMQFLWNMAGIDVCAG